MPAKEILIFSDSFKGSPDGWKRIWPMNFLVGENSTGKTSFFELISLIDKIQFLVGNEILSTDEKFTTPDHIISRIKGGNSVSVGLIVRETDGASPEDYAYSGKLCTYVRDGSELRIKSTSIVSDKSFLKFKSHGKKILCKSNFEEIESNINIGTVAENFSTIHFGDQDGFKKVIEAEEGGELYSQAWMAAEIQAQIADRSKKKKKRGFRPIFSEGPPLNAWQYGPIRGETERYYYGPGRHKFDPKGSHYPVLLKAVSDNRRTLIEKIDRFGAESRLFDRIKIETVSERKKDSPFSIKLIKNNREFFADELGYGVVQILPIITELLVGKPNRTILFQQPEVHLHPKAQAALADILHTVSLMGSILLIETHSDYIIDRFRKCQKLSEIKAKAQLMFFDFDEKIKNNVLYEIEINADGALESAPAKYRQFFIDEEISNFELL